MDILEATCGTHPSQVWHALIEGRDALVQGLVRKIGTEEITHAWNHNWIPRDHMLRPITCTKQDPPTRVSDFIIGASSEWNKLELDKWFLPMDVESICKIPLSTRRSSDLWDWHYGKSGILTVRSVYRMLISTKKRWEDWLEGKSAGSNQAREEKCWTKLWKV
jgi:hypothetical protein